MQELFAIEIWLFPIIEGLCNGLITLINGFIKIFFTPPMTYFTILGIVKFLISRTKRA